MIRLVILEPTEETEFNRVYENVTGYTVNMITNTLWVHTQSDGDFEEKDNPPFTTYESDEIFADESVNEKYSVVNPSDNIVPFRK